ncbi:MAG: 7-carboxy-7-deazaguanine synthase QueE, partial [Planctomycetes bacterium]|nr:7-carboxy-7-deazaguanine synthase QueE [Planctomycetota bacterium]
MRLKVSEIFLSLQGEGQWVGLNSVFVRLAGCNLWCKWCDTFYARNSKGQKSMTVKQVVSQVEQFNCGHVVVTGGEPMIMPELGALLEQLKGCGKYITLETNATSFQPIVCDLVSISPKLAHSTPGEGPFSDHAEDHEKARLNITAIQKFMDNHDYQLKFVVAGEGDLTEIEDLLRQLNGVDRKKVMLMPLGQTQQQYRKQGPSVAQMCIAKGSRYCPRLHI